MATTEFFASLPPIKSAVILSGNGEGGQIKLDWPESERIKILPLLFAGRKALRVTIDYDEDYPTEETGDEAADRIEHTATPTPGRRAAKRRI